MNEEQRAVLAAIARMEESPGTLIDEYTVARAVGILATDLSGHEYVQSAGRERIHRALDEIEALGLVRLDREGFWRPRTTLAGRRALQRPLVALPPVRPSLVPQGDTGRADTSRGALPPATPPQEEPAAPAPAIPERGSRGWPAWWPLALRFGDPALTPIVLPVGALIALLLIVVVGSRLVIGGNATPTPTESAGREATASALAGQPAVSPPPTSASSRPAGASPTARTPTPTRPIQTPTPNSAGPTPTAGPPAARVMVVNTENQGARLYATPAGERRIAVPEGFILEVIGPDARDTKGNNWKHIRYLDFEGWIPEEYTTPVE